MANDADVIKEALERFDESETASSFNRTDAESDIEFSRLADQWPAEIKKQRAAEGRPCLTINKLPSFIRQVVNEARQNKPGIVVSPVDSGADPPTAEVIGGLIRSIERNGAGAEVAYDTAIDHAVTGGFGFFQIAIDYAHADTFDMEARIERIANPLMVHWDTNSTEFDASDWDHAFVSDMIDKDVFETMYPDAEPVSFDDGQAASMAHWLEDDKIRVADYWHREMDTRKLLLVKGVNQQTGQETLKAIREDQLPRMAKEMATAGGLDLGGVKDDELARMFLQTSGLEVVREREVEFYKVTRRKITGVEVLQDDPWPGETIPICPVWGEEVIVKGKRHFRSMIRDARDPQTMFNFWRSASTELVALAPRAPWVGPKGFVPKGQEEQWRTANTRSHSYLEYDDDGGKRVAPTRQAFAGVPAGALQEALNASDDIKAIIGIYDPSLGARSNETSGKAIFARQKESDTSNFHFPDNLNRAIRYAGKVLVDIIPSVYSERSTIRILGEDKKEQVVTLGTQDGPNEVGPDGKPKIYNLNVGKYDVTVKAGPSYSTQREEAREVLIEIMRQVPGAAPYIGDMLADHLDFVGADKLKKRLQMLLPPNIQQAEGLAPPPQAPKAPEVTELDKAKIESLRAAAIANLAKAGATVTGSQLDALEAVLNALNSVQPTGAAMPQSGGGAATPGQPQGLPGPMAAAMRPNPMGGV